MKNGLVQISNAQLSASLQETLGERLARAEQRLEDHELQLERLYGELRQIKGWIFVVLASSLGTLVSFGLSLLVRK